MATGVYYQRDDMPGLGARCVIVVIDLGLLGVLYFFVNALVGEASGLANLVTLLLAWVYMAGLKTTRRGTIGYRAADVRLVDLHGNPVGFWRSSLRFLFMFFGPVNFLVDLLWLTHDEHRQTLRDKLSGTYVVAVDAVPAGRGVITYPNYFVSLMSFVLPEVTRAQSPDTEQRS